MRAFNIENLAWLGETGGFGRPALLDGARAGTDLGPVIGFPGLINSHDHLDFNCYPLSGNPPYPDFVAWGGEVQQQRDLVSRVEAVPKALRRQFGALKNLLWGVTAVSDHTDAPLADELPVFMLQSFHFIHSPEGGKGISGIFLSGDDDRPIIAHMAEGVTEESRQRALALLAQNVLKRPIAGVHGVSLQPRDFANLSALIWCPASNLFLFNRTADVAEARKHTRILFGTDSTISAPGTLWDHLRRARRWLSAEDSFATVTSGPAKFWRLPATYAEDNFVLARRKNHDPLDAFFAVNPDDLLLVVCGGEPVLADPAVLAIMPEIAPGLELAPNRKYVRIPLARITAEARGLDIPPMLSRYCEPVTN